MTTSQELSIPRLRDTGPRRIRILYCIHRPLVGGSELNALRTAEQLDRDRIDLELACLGSEGPLRERFEALGLPFHKLGIRSLYGARTLAAGLRFARFVRDGRFDVVQAHDLYSNIFAVPWARAASAATVIASRRWWTEVPRTGHRIANRMAYKAAHYVVANSPSVGKLLEATEGVARKRVLVVPNFVDADAFVPPPEEVLASLRKELGLANDALVVGLIANFHPIKEHSTLLDAAARLAPRWPSLRIVLVGDGQCREALAAQTRALGLQRQVVFAGPRPHQPSLHHLFDISVLTSRGEGFPNSLVEAMAAGRPVVATAVGGVVDAVVDGETGRLVPPSDPERLAEAIEQLLRDPALRRRLGDEGRRQAEAKYHSRRVLDQLEGLYSDLATARSR